MNKVKPRCKAKNYHEYGSVTCDKPPGHRGRHRCVYEDTEYPVEGEYEKVIKVIVTWDDGKPRRLTGYKAP